MYNTVPEEIRHIITKRFKERNLPTILQLVIESGSNGELEWELGECNEYEETSALWDGERLWLTACSSDYDNEFRTELPYYNKLYLNRDFDL